MDKAQQASEKIAPQTLEEALALLARRDAELAALRDVQQQWVHAVSHDLRAPLRHVLAFNPLIAELLQQAAPSADDLQEACSFLQTMDQSAKRMAAMFDGLLLLSRAARQPLQWQAVDLQAMLQRLQVQLQARNPGHNIEWRLPATAVVVQGDAQLLEQALTAALSNAVKFSHQQIQAQIAVTVEEVSEAMQILVRDNGAGFDGSRADRLFGIFQRMHRDSEFDGVGTGLALIQSICQRHGGQASIEAQLGQGCTLRLSWPQSASFPSQ
ncbi:MAG: sensor histidine kinase [Comamonas sp.]|jgi:light-regulated signal transduction histidine kinase (bacteriophytochrome)|nr:sensor histidine kinase [Comamonas sp.]